MIIISKILKFHRVSLLISWYKSAPNSKHTCLFHFFLLVAFLLLLLRISLRLMNSQSVDFFFGLILGSQSTSILQRNHDAAQKKKRKTRNARANFIISQYFVVVAFLRIDCRSIVKIVMWSVYYGANSRDELVRVLLSK